MLWKTPLNCTSMILDSLNHMPGTMPQKSLILEQNTSLYILHCTIMLGCLLHCGCHWPVWKRIFIFSKTPAFHSFSMTQSFWKTSWKWKCLWSLIIDLWLLILGGIYQSNVEQKLHLQFPDLSLCDWTGISAENRGHHRGHHRGHLSSYDGTGIAGGHCRHRAQTSA